jgi:excisionase family DNA binding protein
MTPSTVTPENGAPSVQAYSPDRTAHLLDCSRATVDRMLHDGVLESQRWGRRVFVTADSISRFLKGGA